MDDERTTSGRARRRAKPLDRIRLEELAVSYVARFSTSAGKLRTYLQRKLRERGFTEGEEPDLDGLLHKFVARGYVDDEAYGRAKAGDLAARGYGARRVEQPQPRRLIGAVLQRRHPRAALSLRAVLDRSRQLRK